jgi:hypothetical protein
MDLSTLPWWSLAWIVLVTGAAGFVHGALGFGYPLIAMPLLSLVLDTKATILIVIIPAFFLSIANAIAGGKWSESIGRFWYLPLAIMAGAYVGTRMVITADPAPFLLVLSFVLLLYLNIQRIGTANLGWIKRHPVVCTIVFGVIGGWVESSTNMNLPVLLILFMGLQLGPQAIVQLANYSGIGGKSAQFAGWMSADGITLGFWLTMLPWVGVAAVALAAGYQVRRRIDPTTYMRWLRGFLWIMAFALLAQFVIIMIGRAQH